MRYVKQSSRLPQVKLRPPSFLAFRPRLLRWMIIFAIWGLGTAVLLTKIARPRTAVHDVDESYWIGSAYYYHLAFQQYAWRHPDWSLLPARENPPLAKYTIGLGLSLAGQKVTHAQLLGSFFAQYEYAPTAWGDADGRIKRESIAAKVDPQARDRIARGADLVVDPALLAPARVTMLVCIVLTSLLVLTLGMVSVGPIPALCASLGFLAHRHVAYYANHALSEAVVLLFSTAAALAVAVLVRPPPDGASLPRLSWRRAALIGLLLGLACAAKMNALVVVLAYAVFLASTLAPWVRLYPLASLRRLFLEGAVAAVAALGTFILINPAILNDISGGLIAAVREHRLTEGIQATFIKGHLPTLSAKVHAVVGLGYFGWGCFIGMLGAVIWALCTGIPVLRFLALWWLVAVALVTWWIPFGWMRYLTPLLVPSVLLGAWAAWRFFMLYWTTTKKALAAPAQSAS